MRHHRETGFTLLEVGLAVTIGVLLMGATVLAFKALKEQQGDAAMRQKTHDLQVLIEELTQPTHVLPGDALLRSAWRQRRPGDHKSNPWGGPVIDAAGTSPDGLSISTIDPGTVMAGGIAPNYTALADGNFQGGIYVYRINPNPDGSPGQAQFFDMSRNGLVAGTTYAVAGNKVIATGGQRHFNVVSGR